MFVKNIYKKKFLAALATLYLTLVRELQMALLMLHISSLRDNDCVGNLLKLKWNPGTDWDIVRGTEEGFLGVSSSVLRNEMLCSLVPSAVHCPSKLEYYFSCTSNPRQPPIWLEIKTCPTQVFDLLYLMICGQAERYGIFSYFLPFISELSKI